MKREPVLTYEEPLSKPWKKIFEHCVSFRPGELQLIQATHSYRPPRLDLCTHPRKYPFKHESNFHYVFGLSATRGLWIRQGTL